MDEQNRFVQIFPRRRRVKIEKLQTLMFKKRHGDSF